MSDFYLLYRDREKIPELVSGDVAMEWAEKKEGGGGTIRVREGQRVDVTQFIEAVSKELYEKRNAVKDTYPETTSYDSYKVNLVNLMMASRGMKVDIPDWVKPEHRGLIRKQPVG